MVKVIHDTLTRALGHHQAGRLDQARRLYREVLEADPRQPDALHYLGVLAHQSGRHAEAVDLIGRALARDAGNAACHCNRGEAYRALGELAAAADCYRRALALQPGLAPAHNNLGCCLRALKRDDEAADCFRAALALHPDYAEAHNNLGAVLLDQGRADAAAESLRRAVRLRPDYATTHGHLGKALARLGCWDEALAAHQTALRLAPGDADLHVSLAQLLFFQGRVGESLAAYREAERLRPDHPTALSNRLFILNYDPDATAAEVFAEHRRWGSRYDDLTRAAPPHANAPDPGRRLRVGYVSPDFRSHAVALFIAPVLARHDAAGFETYCYADVRKPDAVTAQLRGLAHAWRPTVGLGDVEVADLVRADGIDILVDLAGHTGDHRLGALARKPAPLQMTYLGHPNTTGLAAMDARLTDAVADPPGADAFSVERLVRLDEGFCCFALPAEAPPVGPLPALKNGHVTFGSPHNLAKLNDAVLDLWCRVLRDVPHSRLRLFRHGLTGAVRERLSGEFRRRGLPEGRIDLSNLATETVGYGGYLTALSGVDIVLDAFPANAGTTACEALAMGVPLITLYGDRFYGRLSASLLTRVGLADWVASTPDEYVALAVSRARDWEGLARVRAGLRDRVLTRLGDAESFTRCLEGAYRALWREWCAGRAAREGAR